MSGPWEAPAARARGLGAHLLSEERLAVLDRARDPGEWVDGLRDTPYSAVLAGREVGPSALDTAVSRSVAERMATLARWAGPGGASLAPVFLEQDARSVRALLRGSLGGLAPERRLAGAIATPALNLAALETLAATETPGEVAATLTAWGHPLGTPLLEEASRAHTDPYRIEAALARGLARASEGPARAGGRHLRRYVRDAIDTGNLVTALLVVGARIEQPPEALFVPGGGHLTEAAFARAVDAPSRETCADRLRRAVRGSVFEPPLREPPASPPALSRRILLARIDSLARASRSEPLSPLPVLLFVLRLRREAQRVRRALWTAGLSGGTRR